MDKNYMTTVVEANDGFFYAVPVGTDLTVEPEPGEDWTMLEVNEEPSLRQLAAMHFWGDCTQISQIRGHEVDLGWGHGVRIHVMTDSELEDELRDRGADHLANLLSGVSDELRPYINRGQFIDDYVGSADASALLSRDDNMVQIKVNGPSCEGSYQVFRP